jgi:hypothetical protein
MAPEGPVINPSSLTKFRKLRLREFIRHTYWQDSEIALENEIIKSNAIIVDAAHTKACYNQKSPKEFLQEKSKMCEKLFIK